MEPLLASYRPVATRYAPEESPFTTLFADITHRCNMECSNCYIPVRDLPDPPAQWLYGVLERLPRRTRIRLVGAEPTMRKDLQDIISKVRQLGHIPVILSNGLKLGNRDYVRKLKNAGLGTVYISLNGGLRDDLYETIDGMPVAQRKLQALDNLLGCKMHVTTGTIIVPGLNDQHLRELIPYLLEQGVRDMHFRNVGGAGRHMEGEAFDLDGLERCVRNAIPAQIGNLVKVSEICRSRDFRLGNAHIQLTEWPELGNLTRGRIAPDGYLEPMFESILANAHHY